MIDAVVPAFTFTLAVAVDVHPFVFVTVYVIVTFPAVTPVTTPVADTVATAALLVDQVPPVVTVANCVVNPEQTFVAPVIAATAGTLGNNATGNTIFKSNYERMQYLLGRQNQASCGVPRKTFVLGTN